MSKKIKSHSHKTLSRRDFLRTTGAATAGWLVTRCTSKPTAAPPLVVPTATEAVQSNVVVTEVVSTPTQAVSSSNKRAQVAISQATSYEPKVLYDRVRTMLDGLGGLGDIVRPGDRVAIKTNLTGGTYYMKAAGQPAVESFVTHPEVVRALGQLVLDAGAKELFIVEAVYQWDSYVSWGYTDVAKELGATLIDLNAADPYSDYVDVPVPGGGGIYKGFTLNPILQEVDAFMSVSKMKGHWTCGVTHTMKNLVGLVPMRFYRLSLKDGNRSAFHGATEEEAGYRVPRIIVELNKARPVHLGLIDGIKTVEGGEGPWLETLRALEPGVMFAGKNVVALDAVATAAMGFDPTAAAMTAPFVRSDNHLALAAQAGLGTHHLEEIEVIGPAIEDVLCKFKPCVG
ncbi:MAG: DUF362 domain-containing protein [Anaerolineae bacterium]|nr:DUF362 domain-containing protein [Anaerolineae bacterium]